MKNLTITNTLVLTLISFNSNAAWFGPSNYDECALEVSKTAKTDAAVGVYRCLQK